MGRQLALLLMLGLLATGARAGARILGVDVTPGGIAVGLDGVTEHRAFAMENPPRLVLDLEDARMRPARLAVHTGSHPVWRVRSARQRAGVRRLVFDLERPLDYELKVERRGGGAARIVVTWDRESGDDQPQAQLPPGLRSGVDVLERCPSPGLDGQLVVAVDAGHGGKDKGAVGQFGNQEKAITLGIAYRLHRLIARTPELHSVLTRKRDAFVGLEERYRIAAACNAGLLVSIHTDSLASGIARGASVYVHPAQPRGGRLMLAANALALMPEQWRRWSDGWPKGARRGLVQGPSVASRAAAQRILAALGASTPLLRDHILEAQFTVLSSTIPSVLVETGFLSTLTEERRLARPAYQQRVAEALFRGIAAYADDYRRLEAYANGTVHIAGHTVALADLAQRYGVDAQLLLRTDARNTDVIRPGEVVRIPKPVPGGPVRSLAARATARSAH